MSLLTTGLIFFLVFINTVLSFKQIYAAHKIKPKSATVLLSNKKGSFLDDSYSILMKVVGEIVNPKLNVDRQQSSRNGGDSVDALLNYDKEKITDIIMLQKLKFSRLYAISREELLQYASYLPDFMSDLTFGYPEWEMFLKEKYYPIQVKALEGDKQAALSLEKMKLRMLELWGIDLQLFIKAYEDIKLQQMPM